MKQTIITILAIIASLGAEAQSLTIVNSTSCTHRIWVSGHNPTGTCGSMISNPVGALPGTTTWVSPTNFQTWIRWASGGPVAAGFQWDYVRVNSGFNMVGISPCFTLTTRTIPTCTTTGHVTYAEDMVGNATITITP